MIVKRYEGGIPYEVEVPDPTPAQLRAWDEAMNDLANCTCRGECHDECAEREEDDE